MIDITAKSPTLREAIAQAKVYLKPETILAIKQDKIAKGDVLETARIAAILAAKKTYELIPLCHPIPVEHVKIDFLLGKKYIRVTTAVKTQAKTGVEMEALAAASIAALTIYDMCKPIDKDIVISDIKLLKKTGGKSGTYVRKDSRSINF